MKLFTKRCKKFKIILYFNDGIDIELEEGEYLHVGPLFISINNPDTGHIIQYPYFSIRAIHYLNKEERTKT